MCRVSCTNGAPTTNVIGDTTIRYHASAAGRLYVVRGTPRAFERADAEFLQQVVDQVVPLLDNLRLVDAGVCIAVTSALLQLTVTNDGAPPQPVSFLPRSMAERAATLGGVVDVQHPAEGLTAICVEIPVSEPEQGFL